MGLRLFGFEIRRNRPELPAVEGPVRDDGAITVQATASGQFGAGMYVDMDGTVNTETELVTRYRNMAQQPEIDMALEEIVTDAIVNEEEQDIVSLVLDDVEISDPIKEKMEKEFVEIQRLLEFHDLAYEIFRAWYVDGRLYYNVLIDPEKPTLGIQGLRYLDPRKIRKIREVMEQRPAAGTGQTAQEVTVTRVVKEYFIYNKNGFGNKNATPGQSPTVKGIKIAKDSIVFTTSGLVDETGRMVLGYLHKAIKPLNQCRAIEDASVIYRLVRAPERRVFYIDVGNLPKMKADQVIRDMMTKFKNRLVYDSATGEIRDDRKFMTMYEDFWLPRREGGKGTEIDTLPAGENLGNMEDAVFFQKRLYKSLNVPIGRLEPESMYVLGRSAEITKDEVKFSRFIDRVRLRFSNLFLQLLERQLILKNIMTPEDWDKIRPDIKFKYARDSYFAELKEDEIISNRANTMMLIDPYIGKYYSHEWARRHVLHQTEEDIKEEDKKIKSEAKNPILNPPMDPETGEQVQMPGLPAIPGNAGQQQPGKPGGPGKPKPKPKPGGMRR